MGWALGVGVLLVVGVRLWMELERWWADYRAKQDEYH